MSLEADGPLSHLDDVLGRSERRRPALSHAVDLSRGAGRWPWIVAAVAVVGLSIGLIAWRQTPSAEVELPRASPGAADATSGSPAAPGPPSVVDGTGGAEPATGAAGSSLVSSTSVTLVVHVAGAVTTPGLVRLPNGARIADAMAAAGGARPDADLDRVNLAAPLVDGSRVYVPAVGQLEVPVAGPAGGAPGAVGGSGAAGGAGSGPTPDAPLDLNTASAEQLDALPGVGPSTAAAIVAYRAEHGRFRSVDELQEVRGIGPAKFASIAPLVVAS